MQAALDYRDETFVKYGFNRNKATEIWEDE